MCDALGLETLSSYVYFLLHSLNSNLIVEKHILMC